ncbi:MAG: S53 family peptidase, partial [Tumebacillaceae bacterium]
MANMGKKFLTLAAASTLLLTAVPSITMAAGNTTDAQAISQGVGAGVLDNADYFGGLDPSTVVQVDIVMKVQNKTGLEQYIKSTTLPGNANYRKYLTPAQFKTKYAPPSAQINAVTSYLKAFGITSSVYADNLVITATGTAGQFNKAFNVELQTASYKGKKFHGTKTAPVAPKSIADNILCILGLSDYSNLTQHSVKQAPLDGSNVVPKVTEAPTGRMTSDLVSRYNVQPLVDKGATGKGQTIGIVTLADFNPSDAYSYWAYNNIKVDPNRIKKINVDGGSGLSEYTGSDETTLDVEQSGALAPGANMNVYVGPNSDTGFVDAFARAINDNVAHQISVSWGESEAIINAFVQYQMETPEYMEAFNQLF